MKNILKFEIDNYFITACNEEPEDRDVCVVFDKNGKEPILDYYYEEDKDYYYCSPMKIISRIKK